MYNSTAHYYILLSAFQPILIQFFFSLWVFGNTSVDGKNRNFRPWLNDYLRKLADLDE
jgi:hypothetical protein